jgi:glycosyltransferase involved in cell wall biosynthesis
LVTETYPPEVNGVAMTLGRLMEGLESLGHRTQIVRPRQHAADRPYSNGARSEHLLRGIHLPLYPELQVGLPATGALRRLWREQRPDVLYIATEGPLGWSASRVARGYGIPALSGFHTNFHQYSQHYRLGLLRPLVQRYLRGFHRHTRCTLVPTPELRQSLQAQGYGAVEVLARGVDTALFHPGRRSNDLRRDWGVPGAGPVVLYVGRIAPEKNLDDAVRAFQAVRAVRPSARFVLVGDGPLRGPLAARHPEFVFCGTRRGEELARHYASADLFLFPSLTETFGNVVLEAMASGLAVVAYDYAAARMHIRSGENGLLAPLADSEALDQRARDLALAPEDIQRLGRRAREHALRLDWRHVATRFSELLRSCATGGSSP